jgi:large-conductance mechanosensitive channel
MTMSKEQIILAVVYVFGVWLAKSMLKIEHEAEQRTYTKLDVVICSIFSLFSLAMVLFLLVSSWFKMIKRTGYWDKPQQNK